MDASAWPDAAIETVTMDAAMGHQATDAAVTRDAAVLADPQADPDSGSDVVEHLRTIVPPFELDCAALPVDGACQGGPREVLLATQPTGAIVMYDAQDGHFLGYFKHATYGPDVGSASGARDFVDAYHFATQGPDQCIWTVGEGMRGVERWNPDGTFKNQIIDPEHPHFPSFAVPTLNAGRSLSFSRDGVYVGAAHAGPSIAKFDLQGALERIVPIIIPHLRSALALGDSSLVVASNDGLYFFEAGGSPKEPILNDVTVLHVSHAGGSDVLVVTLDSVHRVNLATGRDTRILTSTPIDADAIALLNNGKYLVMGSTGTQYEPVVAVVDPRAPPEEYQVVGDAGGSIGRACLSEAFVQSRASDPPVGTCTEPSGPYVYREDFVFGDFDASAGVRSYHGLSEVPRQGVSVSIDDAMSALSPRSLKIRGGGNAVNDSGVVLELSSFQPSYIGYYLAVEYPARQGGSLALDAAWPFGTSSRYTAALDIVAVINSSLRTYQTRALTSVVPNTWMHIELRDFDWIARTYDLYVDCQRVGDDIELAVDGARTLERIRLFNLHAEAVAWFDDIVVK